MVGKLLMRGLFAGAVAGMLAFVFARVFAEPVIAAAVDYETGRDEAQDALDKAAGLAVYEHGPDMFSRGIQGNIGIGVGMIAFGSAMGLLFAAAFVVCVGRTGRLQPKPLALLVAGFGFLTVYLIPFVKYPANPPAIGHEDTIKERSGFYLLLVLVGVVVLAASMALVRKLAGRLTNWSATLIGVAVFVFVVGVVMALLPQLGMLATNVTQYGAQATETPLPLLDAKGTIVYPGFPADDLYAFRLYSIGAQVVLWSTLGLLFGPLAVRILTPGFRATSRDTITV